jgi:CheY-like chemotaxis protein
MGKKPLAYIIEDHEDMVDIFNEALSKAGYETEMTQDGGEAQHHLKEIVPDVVILDIHVPNVSGDILLKQIRDDKRLDKTRVLIITADAIMAEKLQDQADLVLLKPVSFLQLQQLAERFFTGED